MFCGRFNKTIIPLALLGYEIIIANSYPTRTRGIIVKYIYFCFPTFVVGKYFDRGKPAEYTLSLPCIRVHYMVTPNSGRLPATRKQNTNKMAWFFFFFFSQLLQYIQDRICSHEAHVVANAKRLQNSVTQEVDRFAALPLDQLHYSGLDRSVMQFWVKESLGTH